MGHHQVPNNSAPDSLTIDRREIDWQLCLVIASQNGKTAIKQKNQVQLENHKLQRFHLVKFEATSDFD